MAKFLNTSAANYYLEELIKRTRERLIVISPFLKFNDRIKELLADKDRMKIDVRRMGSSLALRLCVSSSWSRSCHKSGTSRVLSPNLFWGADSA